MIRVSRGLHLRSDSAALLGSAEPCTARALDDRILGPLARSLVARGISANAVTACSLAIGAVAGVLAARGQFGIAALALAVASTGDAIDGMVARASKSASVAGALFDASTDRYGELFFLSGLALRFRDSASHLGLVLLAIGGSFMVSYGSAKAEALRVPVPPGVMRRAQRAVCLTTGTALVPAFAVLVRGLALPASLEVAPILAALAIVGVVGNVSAVHRLAAIAAGGGPGDSNTG